MRGIIRYGPDPVVAILDSARAGEAHDGIPIVGTVEDALRFGPTVAVVGVATQGGRFPPAWRELLKSSIANGLDVESGLHEFVSEDPELIELARRHGVELRDLRRPPTGPVRAHRRESRGGREDRPHGRVGLRDRQEDRRGRARPRGAATGARVRVRADRSDGDRDRGLGDRGRRGGGRLSRGRGRAARRRGCGARREAALRRGPGLARAPAVLGRHPRARARIGAARVRPLPSRGLDRDRRVLRGTRFPRSRSWSSCTSACAPAPAGEGRVRRAQHGRHRRGRRTHALRSRLSAAETGLPADDPVRFGAGPLLDAIWPDSRLRPPGRWGARGNQLECDSSLRQWLHRRAPGRGAVAPAADVGANDDSAKHAADARRGDVRRDGSCRPPADGDRRSLQAERGARHPGQAAPRPDHPERARRRVARRARGVSVPAAGDRGGSRDARRSSPRTSPLSPRCTRRCRQFVIGNEPNQPAFWRPQFTRSGANASGARSGGISPRRTTR